MGKNVGRQHKKVPSQSSKTTRCRKWLMENKIFFDIVLLTLGTATAILVSIMAYIVSVEQRNISSRQKDLSEIQTEISQKRLKREDRLAQVQKSSDWQELRDVMWEIFGQFPVQLNSASGKQRSVWFHKVRSLLDSQAKNPVLIENKMCLGHWRNAITTAKIIVDLAGKVDTVPGNPNFWDRQAGSIMADTSYVWQILVLDSDEVSAIGGIPDDAAKDVSDAE